jgi:Fe-S-cluster containining protein
MNMADPAKKMDDPIQEHPWMEPERLESELSKIARENTSARLKLRKVIAITNRVTEALAPHVACKRGCSHCCHMNTMVYEHEAVRLAEVSGRKMTRLPYRPLAMVYLEGNQFNGKPCTFLVNNECSVYEDRPLVCRTHHSMHDDASLCDMSVPAALTIRPPMYDPDLLEIPYREISEAHSAREPWGNIAEYFPSEG